MRVYAFETVRASRIRIMGDNMGLAYKRTTAGNYLTLIQGGGLGDGKPRARLTLIQGGRSQSEAAPATYRYHYETTEWSQVEADNRSILRRFLAWLGVA